MYDFQCVLLVDDDPIATYLNKGLIKKLNIAKEIAVAGNGQEALNKIQELGPSNCPDLILLDINMPVMNGFEFLDHFYKLTIPGIDKIKIIVLTSSNGFKDITDMNKLGVKKFITKPLKEQVILSVLQEI
jgi:CheY-like chemotaxis protein